VTEWSVVLVIVTLVGLGAAIIKPIVSLTQSITTLTVVVNGLKESLACFQGKNSESHERIWKRVEKQDEQLDDHEKRISFIERK
jgi:predicted PurR-regulated permease PerM